MADRYDPSTFEAKWRQRWSEAELFQTREESGRPKFYGLDFFPYPSGAGLSVGHCRNYVPTDVICRMKYTQGYNVLHPMGFDAFGLPAENEAIKRKTHPAPMIERYAENYRRQMDLIGIGFDWSRSFRSSDPDYYRWTQWIFELLYKRGLAYRKLAAVNWDPVDKTVLADEEVIAGRAERSGALVEKKYIPQWFFRITEYAQALIDDLDTIDWPEGIKTQQRNWIGRSEGVEFTMKVHNPATQARPADDHVFDLDSEEPGGAQRPLTFDVFTTRIDTIFGMTFCVLAPEHPLVEKLPVTDFDRSRVRAYQEQARTLSDADRTNAAREKTGVFTGAYAVNPATGKQVPIWLADYVLATYGTGAIMAVPAGDQRDLEFAIKFDLPVVPIQEPPAEFFARHTEEPYAVALEQYLADPKAFPEAYVSKEDPLINSGEYDGMPAGLAMLELGLWIESLELGTRKIQYKLRDWLISRQRYWGCPIPVIHNRDDEIELVSETVLPVELPWVENYEPTGDGTSPLAHIPDFVNVVDRDGRLGKRETDTMGGFACSSWYFLRFCDPFNDQKAWSPEAAARWMPVDCYVGGAEHAVMHLLYARFWTKVLFDAGYCPVREPFARLLNQGQVLALTPYRKPREDEVLPVGEDGILVPFAEVESIPSDQLFWRWARMSKSKGNVVTPDEMVETYGADALRLYLLFKAPFHADIEWENKGVEDLSRFLSRIFRWVDGVRALYEPQWRNTIPFEEMDETARALRRLTHQTVANVTQDIERFSFNTYVSWMMKFLNGVSAVKLGATPSVSARLALSEAIDAMILLLAPGAPHSADELWESLGHEGFTYHEPWPSYDAELAREEQLTIAVQVNGKLRDTFDVPADIDSESLEVQAKARPKILPYLEGKTIRKVIVVPGKLVNIVAS
jgi:leucyl-tRNA synthetase